MNQENNTCFAINDSQENINGWGPLCGPDLFSELMFEPIRKDIKLGKIADWRAPYIPEGQKGYQNNTYSYLDEDENSFQIVNTAKEQKPNYLKQKNRYAMNKNIREKALEREQNKIDQEYKMGLTKKQKYINRERQQDMRKLNKKFGRLNNNNNNWNNNRYQNHARKEASVPVQEDWKVIEEIDFSRFTKLSLNMTQEPEDLLLCGKMSQYDKINDRITTRKTTKLNLGHKVIHNVNTMDDPNIRKMAGQKMANVFATENLITFLMCSTRSVNSWDIVAQKIGDILILDKRSGNDTFDFETVNETAEKPPSDDVNSINSASNLSIEATYINHNFIQQVLKNENSFEFENANPFIEEDENVDSIRSIGYRYRRFDLGNDIKMIVRCQHDAVIENKVDDDKKTHFLTIRALNEYDSKLSGGIDWRTKLDIQRGAVLGSEIKNNSFKLAKWTVSALLAGSDYMKLGYVSRESTKNNKSHVILGTQIYKPADFATQINLKMDNSWGVLRSVIDICMAQPTGKYLIMRDPNKPMMMIYSVPSNSFEEDEESDSDEE